MTTKKITKLEDITAEEAKLLRSVRRHHMSAEELHSFTSGLRYKKRKQLKLYDHTRGGTKFIFALFGDTHFGNKSTNKEALNDFYNIAYKMGVREFYHTGDMVDGLHVHRGQEYELYALGLEQQVADIVNDYPAKKNATTFFILGNHDLWYHQNSGADVGKRIDDQRPDMVCLGHSEADIVVGNKTILRLMHPGGGSSYALSYKPQKIIENIAPGNKPNILGIGHYHKALFMFYRNVFSYLTGCFDGEAEVETSDGKKKIRNVKIGDKVLTHRNRYRRVKQVHKLRLPNDWVEFYHGRKSNNSRFRCTPEHPILIRRDKKVSWCLAKDLQEGDEVFVKTTKCKQCNNRIPHYRTLCNQCNPADTQIVKNKISLAKIRSYDKSDTYVRKWDNTAKHYSDDILPFARKLLEEGHKVLPIGKVIPDIISIKDNKIILWEIENRRKLEKKYDFIEEFSDFWDEVRWVMLNEKRTRNSGKDYELSDDGVWAVQPINNLKHIKSKRQGKDGTCLVYNLGVEDDNSFVCFNIVVHNCFEEQTPFMRSKNLPAHVGGWIIIGKSGKRGGIKEINAKFIPYMKG